MNSEKLLGRAGASIEKLNVSDAVRRVEKLCDRDKRVRATLNAIGTCISTYPTACGQ